MSKELMWLTYTVVLTMLLWIPYILDRTMVRGLMGAMANPSPRDKPQTPWAQRLQAAHTQRGRKPGRVRAAGADPARAEPFDAKHRARLRGLFWARLAHAVVYALGIPVLRTLAFAVGFVCAGRAGAGGVREALGAARAHARALEDRARDRSPRGSRPNTEPPPSPSRRVAQKASATAAGACLTSSAACSASTRFAHQRARLRLVVALGRGQALEQPIGDACATRLSPQSSSPRSTSAALGCARSRAARRGT